MSERMVQDADGVWRAETKPRMGRRCKGWDYGGRGVYMVTVELKERGRERLAGWPVVREAVGGWMEGGKRQWVCPPTGEGRIVQECWMEIPAQWPGVEVFCHQVMPDHFHGILFVKERLPAGKTLGNVVGSFKSKSASRILAARGQARDLGGEGRGGDGRSGALARAAEVWAEGFVDTILFGEGQLGRMKAYVMANPERLGEKRERPELFRTVRDLEAVGLHFQALGNRALLAWPDARAVQCSRGDFAYRRVRLPGGGWKTLRGADGAPLVERTTPAFEEKCAAALEAAERGAVLVSPCLSHGEREIARRAFAAGARVVVLRNKGFAPMEKPSGGLFRMCAEGRLLLLAPAGWPWCPGEKPVRREDALALNRMAQMLAGGGNAIAYRGAICRDVDGLVAQVCGARA